MQLVQRGCNHKVVPASTRLETQPAANHEGSTGCWISASKWGNCAGDTSSAPVYARPGAAKRLQMRPQSIERQLTSRRLARPLMSYPSVPHFTFLLQIIFGLGFGSLLLVILVFPSAATRMRLTAPPSHVTRATLSTVPISLDDRASSSLTLYGAQP